MTNANKTKNKLLATAATAALIIFATAGGVYYAMNYGMSAPAPTEETENVNAIAQEPIQDLGVATGDAQVGSAPYTLMDMNGQIITQDSFCLLYTSDAADDM
jgi:hypothetical protein